MPARARFAAVLVAAVSAAALAGCAGSLPPAAVHLQHLEVPFAARHPDLLDVWLHRGRVLVRPGRELAATIDVGVRGETMAQAQELARAVAITLDEAGGRTTLALRHAPGADLDAVDVAYVLVVPAHVALRITTRAGDVALRGYRGVATVLAESGRVHARLDGGRAIVHNQQGSTRVEGRFRAADLRAHDGSIEVVLPDAPSPPVRVQAATGSGPLALDLPEDCGMSLELVLDGGRFSSDFPVQWTRDEVEVESTARHAMGLVNGGAGEVGVAATLRSAGGTVALRRLPPGTRTGGRSGPPPASGH
jgi:hypothetical protein